MATETSLRPVTAEAERAVNQALRASLSDQGFQGATVIADADHDGTEVLYVDVNFRLTDAYPPRIPIVLYKRSRRTNSSHGGVPLATQPDG